MNLKEAFRYQNYINGLISSATMHLHTPSNVTKTKQEHLRKKVNAEAEDEIIDSATERGIKHSVDTIVDFVLNVIDVKSELCEAISNAKADCGLDIDASITMNKTRQQMADVLNYIANIKSQERIRDGKAYKFNNEGNQVPYTYTIKEVVSIDFDRNKAKGCAKALTKKADDISNNIDKLMVETEVSFVPPYDLTDSFEETLDQFVAQRAD